MAENDYYSDAPAPAGPAPEPPKEEKTESPTALLPIDFFQGKELEPGATCKIRVEQVMDDQVSVSYVSSEDRISDPEMDDETTENSPPPASLPGPNMFE